MTLFERANVITNMYSWLQTATLIDFDKFIILTSIYIKRKYVHGRHFHS